MVFVIQESIRQDNNSNLELVSSFRGDTQLLAFTSCILTPSGVSVLKNAQLAYAALLALEKTCNAVLSSLSWFTFSQQGISMVDNNLYFLPSC